MNSPEYAVQFGKGVDMGLEEQKAFPYIYTMVPAEEDKWEIDKGRDNLSGIGPTVAAGASLRYPVRTRQDYPFLLLWMKFSVYYYDAQNGVYLWYDPVTLPANWFLEPFDYNAAIGTPLINYIDLSVWFEGPDGRYLYGGMSLNQIDQGVVDGMIPLPLDSVQGYDYGYGQLRTPYLLPTEAVIMFNIVNRHTIKNLTVGAAIYGLKVRI